ncbi:hypothetical protein D9619_011338 [Psilocybe cf. subviscida]|uniref:Cytochrome P450 n=1 Tax=Psilocybe cf. subviscida TaxID=2480587 RepID=A0A8H5F5E1_9AGAR|nr:hypothetical protein D9619_011338 [Psilocybe cf. subviscida]
MSSSLLHSAFLCLAAAGCVALSRRLLRGSRTLKKFPPGPAPKPLIGNILDLPTENVAREFATWSKKYNSNILFATALGDNILVLNKKEDADELLERRAAIYSDRPIYPIIRLLGWEFNIAFFQHDDHWRLHRRICHNFLRRDNLATIYPVVTEKVHELLAGLLSSPEDFGHHNKMQVRARLPEATMYGYDIESIHDPCIEAAEKSTHMAVNLLLPGNSMINILPVLGYIPAWFPGASSHKLAAKVKSLVTEMDEMTTEFVRKRMSEGCHGRRGTSDKKFGYDAAGDTTMSSTMTFLYIMAAYPDIQRKAQAEIDRVVGPNRLPIFEDRESLPYIEAIYREVMRWMPPTQLGVPRRSSEDDYYKGYFIPKGTIIYANMRAMTRDADMYENPDAFDPERYLDESGNLNADSQVVAYGFGRRVCVGKHVASATTWLTIACVAATFNFSKAFSKEGEVIDWNDIFDDSGLLIQKRPFKCSIQPRSASHKSLIEAVTFSTSVERANPPSLVFAIIRPPMDLDVQGGILSTKNSTGLDSTTSTAPPCYTSQKDEASIMARSITPTNDDDDDSTTLSMHSFPDDVTAQFLPSPYSVEDLRMASSASTSTNANAETGPSTTYAESETGRVTPPPTTDLQYEETPTQHAIVPRRNRYDRRSMPAASSSQEISRPSEEMFMYNHPGSSSQPTEVGHLTYRRSEYYDANEEPVGEDDGKEHPTIASVPESTNASAPNLVAEKSQPKPRAKLTKANTKKWSNAPPPEKPKKKEKKAAPVDQKPPRTETPKAQSPLPEPEPKLEPEPEGLATNFVALSRKSTYVKPKLFRPAPATSSITGSFIIDPTLYIPSSVLKAVESPGKRALEIAEAQRQALLSKANGEAKQGDESNPQNTVRQKNLVLEVENGGIDVDVHLLPFPKQSIYNGTSALGSPQGPGDPTHRRMSTANGFVSPTRFSLDAWRHSEDVYSRTPQQQRTRSSVDGHGASAVSSIRKYPLAVPPPRPPPLPTLIDIRLKEIKGITRKSSSSAKPKNEHALVARIHAPNPRIPFHLIASTVEIPPLFRPIPPAEANKSDNKPAAGAPPAPRIVRPPPNRARPIHTLPLSTLTLVLPRTFVGPLTVNIAAGDIDAHLRLSRGLTAAAVVLAESPYSRGFFVGKLAELAVRDTVGDAFVDLGPDWVVMGTPEGGDVDDDVGSAEGTLRPSGRAMIPGHFRDMSSTVTDTQSHERIESSTTAGEEDTKQNDDEWKGDKVDVHGGHGKVYLQFEGEDDPFGKKGHFWSKIGWRTR